MRSLTVVIAVTLSSQVALADTYVRNQGEYGTSQVARDLFGANSSYEREPGLDFGHFEADVSTHLDCGKIDLVTNFEGQFKKLRDQAKAFVQNLDNYVAAAPMLAVCYAAPQICALLRHDQFLFSQNLNLRAQACAAIDRYIDNQADKGAKQLEAEATQNCVNHELQSGTDMASATETCQGTTGMPLRDLSSGINRKFRNGPQRVLASMLSNVGESSSYAFLASLLGEVEIQSDGYWQPLWPEKMLKPYQVARNTFQESVTTACGDLRKLLKSTRTVGEDSVAAIFKEKLVQEDADNLSDLLAADRRIACTALGRALGVFVIERRTAKSEAIMSSALTNGALTKGLKDEYRSRSQSAFDALREAALSEQIPSLETVRNSIRELAQAERAYNRSVASKISGARLHNSRLQTESQTDCVDTQSCE